MSVENMPIYFCKNLSL